jgi:serine/threonine protein kinase
MGLRAPELVLGLPFDQSIDIWSFGCLVFEFVTGTPLFAVSTWSRVPQVQRDDDHLLQMTDVLGELPENLFNKWTRAPRYFGPSRERINSIVEEYIEGEFPAEPPYVADSLETYFREHKSGDVDERESSFIIGLVRRILQYDPEKRPSAADLLRDPWFREDSLA